jgi:hypothetical protein
MNALVRYPSAAAAERMRRHRQRRRDGLRCLVIEVRETEIDVLLHPSKREVHGVTTFEVTTFRDGVTRDADIKARIDYSALLPLRCPHSGDWLLPELGPEWQA